MSEVASSSGIDMNVLATLESRLGRPSMIGLIGAHLRHGKAVIARLETMSGTLDRKELHALGHQIVGSCGSIGLLALSRLGGTLEDEALGASIESLRKLVAATLEACRQAQAVLLERYPEVAV